MRPSGGQPFIGRLDTFFFLLYWGRCQPMHSSEANVPACAKSKTGGAGVLLLLAVFFAQGVGKGPVLLRWCIGSVFHGGRAGPHWPRALRCARRQARTWTGQRRAKRDERAMDRHGGLADGGVGAGERRSPQGGQCLWRGSGVGTAGSGDVLSELALDTVAGRTNRMPDGRADCAGTASVGGALRVFGALHYICHLPGGRGMAGHGRSTLFLLGSRVALVGADSGAARESDVGLISVACERFPSFGGAACVARAARRTGTPGRRE